MELIIKNANVVTMDNNKEFAEAVAVRNGIIEKVGSNGDILALRDKDTKIIDLDGKLMLPAFNDSHMHLLSFGLSLKRVSLKDAVSIVDIINKLKGHIENNKIEAGKWLQGIGWNQDYFDEKVFPTRYDLDKISMEHPICITRACYHIAVVNSKALEVMNINKDSCQIDGGKFDIDDKGELTGVFRENAVRLIYDTIPEPTLNEIKEIIYDASVYALSKGITSIQTDDFEHLSSKNYEKIIRAYRELIEEGRLKVRINEQCLLPNKVKLEEFLQKGYRTGEGDDFFKIGPLKLLTDGSLGARTALLSVSYKDDPSTKGISVYDQEALNELVIMAHNSGMQIAVHCIGDKALELTLNSFELAQKLNFRNNARHSIVHCQITDDTLLNRLKELDIMAHIQPIFLDYDLHIVEDRVGKELAITSYNWKTMLDKGIKVACGSDCPVEKLDVLPNIYCAVNRMDLNGYPEKGWLPEQKLSVYQAVYGFTMGASYASFEEELKGSITEGKLADFVVLSENVFEINPASIKDVKVLMTFTGGELVFEEKEKS